MLKRSGVFIIVFIFSTIFSVSQSWGSRSQSSIYSSISSKLISSNSIYGVTLFVEPGPAPLTFTGAISGQTSSEIVQPKNPVTIHPGRKDTLQFQIRELEGSKYNLTLKIEGGGLTWENVTTIFKSQKDISIFMHTDKPLYKPGETVRFRVVVLDRDLKPFTLDPIIQVKILDAERNIIKLWDNQNVQNYGVFNSQLELSAEPVLGNWQLEVRTVQVKGKRKGQSSAERSKLPGEVKGEEDDVVAESEEDEINSVVVKQLTFTVEKVQRSILISGQPQVIEYVLPKFKVVVRPPPFLTYDMTLVPIQVEAKYTYGKGVTGEALVSVHHNWGSKESTGITVTGPLRDGTGLAMMDVDFKGLFDPDESRHDREIIFDVSVTENATGVVQNGTAKVKVHKYPYKIESIPYSSNLKPGLPFTVGFKISTQDNIPIVDPSPNALKIAHGFSYRKEASFMTSTIPANGSISLTFDTPTNELIRAERIELTYKDLTHRYYVPQNYDSKFRTYMSVSILNGKKEDDPGQSVIPVGGRLIVNVNVTKEFESINYIIQGRKEVIASGKILLTSPVKEHNFDIVCPDKATPEANLIVYVILSDSKEVIVDNVKFTATASSNDNYLDITLSSGSIEPGHNLMLKVNASRPHSLVALRGVDQSVLLGKLDNDIDQDSINQEVKEKDEEAVNSHRIRRGSNAFQVFEKSGLIILTNAQISVERRHVGGGWSGYGWGNYHLQTSGSKKGSKGKGGARPVQRKNQPANEIRVRTHFPETWIWDLISLNDTTRVDLTRTVPDTLTSWLITGYSINKDFGITALQTPQKLTVFRPFFITLNLPYQVVKNEVLALQVLVHNYLTNGDKPTTVEVTLDNPQRQFQFAEKSLKEATSSTRKVTCPANSVTSVTFIIVPQEFGSVMLNVKGVAPSAGDAVRVPLRVRPPGEEQRRSVAALLMTGGNKANSQANLTAAFPTTRVEGADNVKMTIVSDILGPSIENLDKLLKLPTGCGEQNMLHFVPDIVILNYLKSSHGLTKRIEKKAVNFLEKGYQRELTYRHSDGSYSAFGMADESGSTWLTAFVTKSFIQAKPWILIDDQIIERALDFLVDQQDSDSGAFAEIGKVAYSDMQGGSASTGLALTAYNLITFLEASQNWNKTQVVEDGTTKVKGYSKVIRKATKYIKNKASLGNLNDNYALILTTYALHLADDKEKDKYFNVIEGLAKEDGELKHWENRLKEPKPTKKTVTDHIHPSWEFRTKSVAVEMTSYVLLINLLRGRVAESTPIVRWLLKQRNSNGGFVSTQDTVVGLTALAKFAQLTKDAKTDLTVKAVTGDRGEERQIKINEANAGLLQEFILPPTTSWVDFEVTGKGTALVQLSWSYFIEDPVSDPAFSLDIKVDEKLNTIILKICTSFILGGQSNMAIVEVNLPSGYEVDEDLLLQEFKKQPLYKRHEIENQNTKLEVYLESLNKTSTCLQVFGNRVYKLAKLTRPYVTVYDYYDLTRKARVFYEPPNTESICDLCIGSGDCAEKNCV